MRRRVPFPFKKGPVAASPRVWGSEFDVLFFEGSQQRPFEEEGDWAIVDICGPLEQHAHWMCDSYDSIATRMAAAFASDKQGVVMRISSPGGDFAGSIELARTLRAMSAQSKKPLVAFTDSTALSAGYALACAATSITITQSAFVGSIGVWSALVDETARNRALGVNVAIIASGDRKADRNPNVALTEGALAHAQAQVDDMAQLFFEWVAEARSLSIEAVSALEGSEQFGAKALELKLADNIVNSWGEFIAASPRDNVKGKTMAKNAELISAMKAVMKMLEDSDKEEDKAAAEGEEEEKEPKAAAEKKDMMKAEADDDEKKAKAEGEEKEDKAAAQAQAGVVSLGRPQAYDLAAKFHALEARLAAKEDAEKRAALFAKRPDFSPEVKALLADAPIDMLKKAVETMPRGTTPSASSVAALTPKATRGNLQDSEDPGPQFVGMVEAEYIAKKMGTYKEVGGVKFEGRTLTLGAMTPDQAREVLSKKGAV